MRIFNYDTPEIDMTIHQSVFTSRLLSLAHPILMKYLRPFPCRSGGRGHRQAYPWRGHRQLKSDSEEANEEFGYFACTVPCTKNGVVTTAAMDHLECFPMTYEKTSCLKCIYKFLSYFYDADFSVKVI